MDASKKKFFVAAGNIGLKEKILCGRGEYSV
jgi:hypothetical protein